MRLRVTLLALCVAGLAAACVPVAPGPPPAPESQTCSPFWRGYVVPSDHNYAGIGAYNGSDRYMCKPTPRRGVRAQIQHLRNYADPASTPYNLGAPLETRPQYNAANFESFVYHGQAPRWVDLEGRWAVPGTTYWDTIHNICDGITGDALPFGVTIMGKSRYTAAQIAARVIAVGNPWKPEVSPQALAQIYIDEGNKAGVRGDIAFCQSILETGWFSWPSSPAEAQAQQATTSAVPDETTTTSSTTTSTTTTTTTVPGDPSTTTTTTAGDPTTTTTTTTTAPPPAPRVATPPPLDPVFALYFELRQATKRY